MTPRDRLNQIIEFSRIPEVTTKLRAAESMFNRLKKRPSQDWAAFNRARDDRDHYRRLLEELRAGKYPEMR